MLLKFSFLLCLIGVGRALAICPPAEDIIPCTCDEETRRIYCSNQVHREPWDIKATFDKISTNLQEDDVLEEIVISLTNLTTFPAGAFQNVKFHKIYIEFNYQLTYIHPDAFGETANVTSHLSIIENRRLTNEGEGHTERDLFDVLSKFKNATTILIHLNAIRSIPDEGFGPLPNLRFFRLCPGNQVVRVGSRAFSGLPSLESAELASCDISINKIADDAFEGVGPNAVINMEFNPISRLPEVPFKPLLDNAKLAVGGQECWWGCTDVPLDCDAESAWLCQDVEKYQPRVKGFFCRSGSGYNNIWDYCAGEYNTTSIKHI